MPHIRFRSVKAEYVQELSELLCKGLAEAMFTSMDNFTFEAVTTQFFCAGQKTESYPFVEVLWFERTPEIQDHAARLITEQVKKIGGYEDVIVIFQSLNKAAYYENGEHF